MSTQAAPQSDAAATCDFLVGRTDLKTHKFVDRIPPSDIELAPSEILVKVDAFAFTANNVTYAVAGDFMNYWGFFPAEDGWGRVPVWGFGDVVRSSCDDVAVGERLYGYYPMSTHLVMQPTRVKDLGFTDGAAHRQELHAVYNQYTRVAADPSYDAATEDQQMLLRPLFVTSFVLDDLFADNDFFGAKRMVLSSASSKTAFGLAFLLHENRRDDVEVVGLTSPSNVAFVERLGIYDKVVTYDNIETLDADIPSAYVDMSGNADVLKRVHTHLADSLKYSCLVGGTHWEQLGGGIGQQTDLPGAKPIGFFAPDQIKKRNKDWGAEGLQQRIADAWQQFLAPVGGWLNVVHLNGKKDVERIYADMLNGRAHPDQAYVLSLHE